MIGGRIIVDLSAADANAASEAHTDRSRLQMLEHCPDGAEVTVFIGQRRYVSQDAAVWLHEHDSRLEITIEGADPDVVLKFVRSARSGEWSVVA